MFKNIKSLFSKGPNQQEQENLRLEQELKRTQSLLMSNHRKAVELKESVFSFLPFDLANPLEQFFNGTQLIQPLVPSRLDYRTSTNYIFLSEVQLDVIRYFARFLLETNFACQGVIKILQNYVIKKGFTYTAVPKRKKKKAKEYVEKVQDVIDQFRLKNNWLLKELDTLKRDIRDGESFKRFFPQPDGVTIVRFVNPELIRAPQETPEWAFGIETTLEDNCTAIAYWVMYTAVVPDGERVLGSEIVHSKRGMSEDVKRGISDFYAVQDTIQQVWKLLRAGIVGETARASVALIRTFEQATQATVTALQSANTSYDVLTPSVAPNGPANAIPAQIIQPGAQVDIPEGMKYSGPPIGNTANTKEMVNLGLRSLATRWQLPDWALTSEGAANFATALAQESPFVRNIECEQGVYELHFKQCMIKAVEIAIEQGLLPDDTLDFVDISVEGPPVTVRNKKEDVDKDLMLLDKKVISKQSVAENNDLDYDDEQSKIEEEDLVNPDPLSTIEPPEKPPALPKTPSGEYTRAINRPE